MWVVCWPDTEMKPAGSRPHPAWAGGLLVPALTTRFRERLYCHLFEKTYFAIPYRLKDELAKPYGLKWSPARKLWYTTKRHAPLRLIHYIADDAQREHAWLCAQELHATFPLSSALPELSYFHAWVKEETKTLDAFQLESGIGWWRSPDTIYLVSKGELAFFTRWGEGCWRSSTPWAHSSRREVSYPEQQITTIFEEAVGKGCKNPSNDRT